MNALLVVLIFFSALGLFVTVRMFDLGNRITIVNQYYPIEGTDYLIRYSTLEGGGIYEGPENAPVLKLAGRFGFDWGSAVEGNTLYINEYETTDTGILLCNVVKVDLETFTKETLLTNSILVGRCASGEIVCQGDAMLPSVSPITNSLCKFYSMSSPVLRPEKPGSNVIYLDPVTAEVLYKVRDNSPKQNKFEERFLSRTLQEVME